MACEKLRTGVDMACGSYQKRYYQQLVLVNRSDLLNKKIVVSSVSIDDVHTCRHRVFFNLKPGKTGYRFTLGENASSIYGTAEKTIEEGVPQYVHSINMVLLGVDEASKCILSQLDKADYFGALQFYDGTIEIFGFEYGMTTGEYAYDPQNSGGGAIIKLVSLETSLEDELPFIYKSATVNGEIADFDANFAVNIFNENGDFNADFNNDFYNN